MKPLLVGEAPGPNGNPEKPLDGRPILRLAECMAFNIAAAPEAAEDRVRDLFEIRNLLDRPMERAEGSKGCEWPEEEAEEAANRLAVLVERGQRVVFLGKRVAAAFPAVNAEGWWTWHALGGLRANSGIHYATIPHPSGIVRTWNDPMNRVRAGVVLWQAVGKIGIGIL